MIDYLTWISLSLIGLMAMVALVPAIGFAAKLRRWKRPLLADEECPKAAIVLVLRGGDPFLGDCIERLIDLDYPDYDVRIVIDHTSDPAWAIVHEVMGRRRPDNLQVEALREPLETCTLNCSSIVQAVSGLNGSYEVIAICDADTNPHRAWLRELVAPLIKDNVDVVTGQRWYMPAAASLGALVRYVWNAASVVAVAESAVWGGSCAMTRKCLKDADLLDGWRNALGSDAFIFPQIRRHGFRLGLAPAVMMPNREACSLISFFRWLQRQLFVGKLYLTTWPLVLAHGILSTLALAAAVTALTVALIQSSWIHLAWMGAGLGVYWLGTLLVLAMLEGNVQRICKAHDESPSWFGPAVFAKLIIAIPLAQVVYLGALFKAVFFMCRFEWRGVAYEVRGSRNVRMLGYSPYQPRQADGDNLASL